MIPFDKFFVKRICLEKQLPFDLKIIDYDEIFQGIPEGFKISGNPQIFVTNDGYLTITARLQTDFVE